MKMSPYKVKKNNDIEVTSIIAGMLIQYCGIVFEESQDHHYPIFDLVAMLILVAFNIMFLTEWMYYFLESLNSKNENLRKFIKMYGSILCKNKDKGENDSELIIDEPQNISSVKDKGNKEENKKVRKKKFSTVKPR